MYQFTIQMLKLLKCKMGIKALKREFIIDKIRDEVLEYIDDVDIAYEICGIFDKYSVESEDKE